MKAKDEVILIIKKEDPKSKAKYASFSVVKETRDRIHIRLYNLRK
ncbi:MAG: hypothetical protein WA996_23100 [Candidatus Promineifilaceae bacterium]